MKNLSECKFNRSYIVEGFDKNLSFKVKRRLCDLGLLPGLSVFLVRRSVLGRAYLIELRGYMLSIRANIAKAVIVK